MAKTKYLLEYTEGHYYWSALTGSYYGGLTLYTEEFDSWSEREEYIKKYHWEWTPNPRWGNMCYHKSEQQL